MGVPISQNSFTAGEVSPQIYGRTDFPKYYNGLRTCINFIVRHFGGVDNRPGTQYITSAKDQTKRVRLIPFQFSADQEYVLEFGHLYARIIYNGALVVDGSNDPIVVTTPYSSSDLRTMTDIDLIKYVQSGDIMTICNQSYQPKQMERLSATSWQMIDYENEQGPFQEINTDESKTMYSDGITGTVTLTSNFDIFTADSIGQLLYIEQMPDTVTWGWEVQVAIFINSIRRAGAHWYLALNSGVTGTIKPTTNVVGEVDVDGGSATAPTYLPPIHWLYIHSGFGIVKIIGVAGPRSATATVIRRLPNPISSGTKTKPITNVTTGTLGPPEEYAVIECLDHGFITNQSINISGVLGATEVNGIHIITVIDSDNFSANGVTLTSPYISGGSAVRTDVVAKDTYKWAFEAWKSDQGYPMCSGYYQQRQIFAASSAKPQTLWMSQTVGFSNFARNIPLLDDDAISLTVSARKMNEIRHILDLDSLILLTSDGPFIIGGGQSAQNSVITPATISAKRQGQNDCSHVPPILVNDQAVFLQDKGSQVRSLGYSFQQDKYVGQDLTLLSNHLFENNEIVDWSYQEIPFHCIWCVRDDGILIGMTYFPEQQVVGWHRHVTDGWYESVCCIREGDSDAVYVAVKRLVNGSYVRYIERFDDRKFTDIRDAFFVDCGLSYDGRDAGSALTWTLTGGTLWEYTESLTFTTSAAFFVGASDVGDVIVLSDSDGIALRLEIIAYISSTAVTVTASREVPLEFRGHVQSNFDMARNTLSGMDHLEGKTVAILGDGFDYEPQVVTGGIVTIDPPAVVAHVGLPYNSDFETLDINDSGRDIRTAKKRINRVSLVLKDSLGVFAGHDSDNLTEFKQRYDENYQDQVTPLTGITDPISVPTQWEKPGRIFVRQSKPLPLSILAAIPEVDLGGI